MRPCCLPQTPWMARRTKPHCPAFRLGCPPRQRLRPSSSCLWRKDRRPETGSSNNSSSSNSSSSSGNNKKDLEAAAAASAASCGGAFVAGNCFHFTLVGIVPPAGCVKGRSQATAIEWVATFLEKSSATTGGYEALANLVSLPCSFFLCPCFLFSLSFSNSLKHQQIHRFWRRFRQ